MANDVIDINGAPAITGLLFRRFRGPSDFPLMAAVFTASAEADHVEQVTSIEQIAFNYAHLVNSDPERDMIFAEKNKELIGYARCWWYEEANGPHLYGFLLHLLPAWRGKGIGRSMLHWLENRLCVIAGGHPVCCAKFFQAVASQYERDKTALLEREGYQPVRFSWEMVRQSLDDIPDFPLPAGLEVRPSLPEHYRPIWEASNEAFRDHWGYAEPTEDHYQAWLADKTLFQPHLWQIAWDIATDQVAGQVRTFIDHAQHEKFKRKRSYTESISVRRPWRRRGLARALISLSLRAQKE